MKDELKIGICIPSPGVWTDGFGKSLAMLVAYYSNNRVGKCKKQTLTIFTIQGSMLVQMRHSLVGSALRNNCTHLLFLDSDMVFPKDTLHRMLMAEKEVLLLNCTTRKEPVQPVAHDLKQERIDSSKRTGIEEISQSGLAVGLIEQSVFKRLTPPLFMMEWIPQDQVYCGEDVYFCMKLQEAGIKIYTDHDLSKQIEHQGSKNYNYSDVRQE